jgi:PAS domain S-box-containing protein
MARRDQAPRSGRERTFEDDEVLTSKTDTRGVITYANDDFCRIAGYEYAELHGAPHSLIRHPDMPRCVFNLMWKTLKDGREFFGYVVNRCKNGDHYWVLAHVVPDIDPDTREVVGFHSTRRCPSRQGVAMAQDLYDELREAERRAPRERQVEAGWAAMSEILNAEAMTYEEWIFSKINKWEVV